MGTTKSVHNSISGVQSRQITISADDDITTGTNEDLELIPNGTGIVIIGSSTATGAHTVNGTLLVDQNDADSFALDMFSSTTTGIVRERFKNSNATRSFAWNADFGSGTENLSLSSDSGTILTATRAGIITLSNTQASSSHTTGALIVGGGLGVAGRVNLQGGNGLGVKVGTTGLATSAAREQSSNLFASTTDSETAASGTRISITTNTALSSIFSGARAEVLRTVTEDTTDTGLIAGGIFKAFVDVANTKTYTATVADGGIAGVIVRSLSKNGSTGTIAANYHALWVTTDSTAVTGNKSCLFLKAPTNGTVSNTTITDTQAPGGDYSLYLASTRASFFGGTVTFNQNVVVAGQAYSSQDTESGSGTAHTINFNDGNSTVLDLQEFSGDVTLTLSNPVAGASYIVKVIQGSTARNIIWPVAVLWAGGAAPTISTGNNEIDTIGLYYDGTNYLGVFHQDYS